MRVISGKWRGRRLRSPKGDLVRPTADRVKEALFSILGSDTLDTVFLDLCCGAGGLGIEALSRGADRAIFVDNARSSLAIVSENLELCGAESRTWDLIRANVLTWLTTFRGVTGGKNWILLADPPYNTDIAGKLLANLESLALLPGFKCAVLEYNSKYPLDIPQNNSLVVDIRNYGKTSLAIVKVQE